MESRANIKPSVEGFEQTLKQSLASLKKQLLILGAIEDPEEHEVKIIGHRHQAIARMAWNIIHSVEDFRDNMNLWYHPTKAKAISIANDIDNYIKAINETKFPEFLEDQEIAGWEKFLHEVLILNQYAGSNPEAVLDYLAKPMIDAIGLAGILGIVRKVLPHEFKGYVPSSEEINKLLNNETIKLGNREIDLANSLQLAQTGLQRFWRSIGSFAKQKPMALSESTASTSTTEDASLLASQTKSEPTPASTHLEREEKVYYSDDDLFYIAPESEAKSGYSSDSESVSESSVSNESVSESDSGYETDSESESDEMTWEQFVVLTARLKQQMQDVIAGNARLTDDLQEKIIGATEQLIQLRQDLEAKQAGALQEMSLKKQEVVAMQQQIELKQAEILQVQAHINGNKAVIKACADTLNDHGYEFEDLVNSSEYLLIKENEAAIDRLHNEELLPLGMELLSLQSELAQLVAERQALENEMDERELFIEEAYNEFCALKHQNEHAELSSKMQAALSNHKKLQDQVAVLSQTQSGLGLPSVSQQVIKFCQKSLDAYLQKRDEHYKVRDFFDGILTQILSCFGDFKTEKEKRHEKVSEIQGAMNNYANNKIGKQSLFAKLNLQPGEFKARTADIDSDEYKESFRGVLDGIKQKLN